MGVFAIIIRFRIDRRAARRCAGRRCAGRRCASPFDTALFALQKPPLSAEFTDVTI
jgi:hypothetical protein